MDRRPGTLNDLDPAIAVGIYHHRRRAVEAARWHVSIWRLGDHPILPSGASDIAGGGQSQQAWGPPRRTDVFSLGHAGLIAHVLADGIDPGGVVNDAFHNRICVHTGADR